MSTATRCARFARPDPAGAYLARADIAPPLAYVDGDDWLARVNRTPRGRLAPGYAPRDLVDVRTMALMPAWRCIPPEHQCLRRPAALALRGLFAAMRQAGERPWVDSAFRGHGVQCAVFGKWAYEDARGFCNTVTVSALPGHSQHQLGTAIDLFTHAWVAGGARFREGFGCAPGGRWLAANSWRYGFVLPYPLHPDDRAPGSDCSPRADVVGRIDPRTGYKYEPWHLRFIGEQAAARYHAAWLASGPGGAAEITLEQWLRAEQRLSDAAEPPVCDGCACGGCATFDRSGAGPCGTRALVLDATGAPLPPAGVPRLLSARIERVGTSVRVRASVEVPANTLTQPPLVHASSRVRFDAGRPTDFEHVALAPGGLVHSYPPLLDAWRIAVGLGTSDARFPYRAALVDSGRDAASNGINARIPASSGRIEVVVPIDGVPRDAVLRAVLFRGRQPAGTPVWLR